MRPIFENITFGTFTAIVMGVILCCLACLVVTLSCCKKKLPRRVLSSVSGMSSSTQCLPSHYSDSVNRNQCITIPPPPRYEDLFHYFDSPPPYQSRTLLALSQSKLNSREDILIQTPSESSTCLNEDPKVP